MVCRNSLKMATMTSSCASCLAVSNLNSTQDVSLNKPQPAKPQSLFRFNVSVMEAYSKFVAEVLGTAILMFCGCMGCITWKTTDEPSPYMGGISFGLTVMILIQVYGHISGAHFNPAVTLAAIVFRLISIPMAILYFFAQLIGATLGYRCLQAITPTKVFAQSSGEYGFCQTVPHEDLNEIETFVIEYVATMMLISLCCGVWDKRNSKNQDSVPLKFGLAIAVLSFIFGPFSGCSMNPVRTFAPAFWSQNWPSHWVYWVAPMLSALVTSVGYKVLFVEKPDKDFEAAEPLQQDDLTKV